MEKKGKISQRLSEAMRLRNMPQAELSRRTGIGKSSICQYLKGDFEPKQANIRLLAKALEVSEDWLSGMNVDRNPRSLPANAYPVDSLPMLRIIGSVKAGYDGVAYEDVEGYAPVAQIRNPDEHFLLRVTGDSMEPQILAGDLAIVHKQEDVDSGDIAVCIVNGDEGTIKRVIKQGRAIVLQAFNPAVPPRILAGEDLNDFLIAGKVVGLTRRF